MSKTELADLLGKLSPPGLAELQAYVPSGNIGSDYARLDAMESPYGFGDMPAELQQQWLSKIKAAQVNRYPDQLAPKYEEMLRQMSAAAKTGSASSDTGKTSSAAGTGEGAMSAAAKTGSASSDTGKTSSAAGPGGDATGAMSAAAKTGSASSDTGKTSSAAGTGEGAMSAAAKTGKVLLGNGSDELILLIMLLCGIARGGKVLSPAPSFSMYSHLTKAIGGTYIGVDLEQTGIQGSARDAAQNSAQESAAGAAQNSKQDAIQTAAQYSVQGSTQSSAADAAAGFGLDLAKFTAAIKEHKPQLIFIAQPNNPTGNLLPEEAVRLAAEANSAKCLVVVDRAYDFFCPPEHINSQLDYSEYENLIELRTLSKIGTAGLRFGFALGSPAVMAQLAKLRLPYNINTLTMLSIEFLLDNLPWFQQRAAEVVGLREELLQQLQEIDGLQPFPSATNFILFRVVDAAACHKFLLERKIITKNFSDFHPLLKGCIRASIGRAEENERLLEGLREYAKQRN